MTLETTDYTMYHHVFYQSLFLFTFGLFFGVVAHVDTTSNSSPADDTKVGLSTGVGGSAPGGPSAVSVNGVPADAVLTRATECPRFQSTDTVQLCRFTDLDDVKSFRSLFAECVLHSVTVTLVSLYASAPGSSARVFRFGLVGRGTSLSNTVGSVLVSSADRITFAKHFVAGSTVNSSTSVTWGEGGEPFPPGIQLDFNFAEVRFKLPEVFVACANPRPSDGKTAPYDMLYWHIEYTFHGRGVAGLNSFRL